MRFTSILQRGALLVVLGTAHACLSNDTSPSSVAPTGTDPDDTSSPREAARSYARESIACTNDSECCVVIDGCLGQALVVAASDKEKVASLVAQDAGPCAGCGQPYVEVSCVNQKCTGAIVEFLRPDSGLDSETLTLLRRDHCGSVAGARASTEPVTKPRTILGCGSE